MAAGVIDPAMEVRLEPAPTQSPPPGATAAYGAYLAGVTCQYCHGADLRGGQPPEPGAPPAPDLAVAGRWPLDVFKQVLRTGRLPGGDSLDPVMPISMTAPMTDDDLAALHAHFGTLGGATPVRGAAGT